MLFGAGKSATALIEYLKLIATQYVWKVVVADANLALAKQKTDNHPLVTPVGLDIMDSELRRMLISKADVVISLLPPALHIVVARDCVELEKHLLTASYVDDEIKALKATVEEKGLLFLCEMGLDPGIDHMSAMKLVDEIKESGGEIISFKSHCGGLITPESDDNPWHYKITWNPRYVVHAGKAGATFLEEGDIKRVKYEELFSIERVVDIPDYGVFAYYPNRDSLGYLKLYELDSATTFLRTTLRHPEFCFGWKNIVDLKLTDEETTYDTDGMSYADFFRRHFDKHGFAEWLNQMLMSRLSFAKDMMEKLVKLMEAEEEAESSGENLEDELMLVNDKGELSTLHVDEVKDRAAESVAYKMHEANLSMRQLFFLGLDDETLINLGTCTAADILQSILEKKLAMKPEDKDWVLMLHEIEYLENGEKRTVQSLLSVKGDDDVNTAMAKTVGLPLGIAAKLLLEGKLTETGVRIPTSSSIYYPVLSELRKYGIEFTDYKS